ncbi:MAG: Protease-4 [Myxococcales bacterium]|nr:Protease-4 [Myxococcales bacterium]
MRARLIALATVLWASLVACDSAPSRLDHAFDGKPKTAGGFADPWAKSHDKDNDDDDKGGRGGFDLQGILAKIKDTIEKPGPYEAPEKSADFDETKPHWGVLKIGGEIVEREAFSWTGGHGTELRQLIDRLRELAKDDKISGLVLRVETLDISLPDITELRAAMHDFRAAKKPLHCHAETATNATYLVLSACDKIALAPLGDVMIPGPAAMPVHIKPLLDKLGIQADFLHVGAYKGAAEPLTRDAPSKEMEETIGAILDRRYQTMLDTIATERKLEPASVKALIDTALFPADQAKAARLVDDIVPYEAFRDATRAPWTKLELDADKPSQLQAMMKIARFVGAMPPERPIGDHVAVVYAIGNIVDGEGQGVLGARQEIASHTMVAALRALAADDHVKAVVLRIDSGGGSAQASELIWHAVADLKTKKPVIVSMSDVAASGGYYIASGATEIFALADTLTGSIGVVGGKIAPAGALAKLGVNTFPMGRGKHATLMASLGPWNDDEKAIILSTMQAVYTVFVGRVAEGRHKLPAEIQVIAQGRVWTGTKAKELGLVDQIGGLDAALAEAQKLGKVDPAIDLEVYPPSPTLRDVLHGFGQVQTPFGLHVQAREMLRGVDPKLVDATERLVDLAVSFTTTRIQAISILPVLQ